MGIRSALQSSASRFAHLGAAPARKDANAEKPADDKTTKDPAAKEQSGDGKNASTKVPEDTKLDEDEDDDETSDTMDDDDLEEEIETTRKAKAAGHSAVVKAATRIERRRCAAILGSKHAAGRVAMACELAFNTSMKAKDAHRVLAAAPEQSDDAHPFAKAMASTPEPNIGTDGAAPKAETPGNRLIANAQERAKAAAAKARA